MYLYILCYCTCVFVHINRHSVLIETKTSNPQAHKQNSRCQGTRPDINASEADARLDTLGQDHVQALVASGGLKVGLRV